MLLRNMLKVTAAVILVLAVDAQEQDYVTVLEASETDAENLRREFNQVLIPEGEDLAGFEDPEAGKYLLSIIQSGHEEVFEMQAESDAPYLVSGGSYQSSFQGSLSDFLSASDVNKNGAASADRETKTGSVFSGLSVQAPKMASPFFYGMPAWPSSSPFSRFAAATRGLQQVDELFAELVQNLLNANSQGQNLLGNVLPNGSVTPDTTVGQTQILQQQLDNLLQAAALPLVNEVVYTGAEGLEKTADLPCQSSGKIFLSTKYTTIPNVDSLYDCQLICQLYSNPAILMGCVNPAVDEPPVCIGVSFNTQDGRCSIFSDISATADAPGIDSAPVACTSEMFAVPETLYDSLQQDSLITTCLQQAADSKRLGLVAHIPDSYVPGLLSSASVSEIESFSGKQTTYARQLLTDTLNRLWPTWTQELPEYTPDTDYGSDTIWHYNPPIPASLKSDVFSDGIYQPQELSFSALQIPLGQALWSLPTAVQDWRECVLLCAANSGSCEAWTYVFDPVTYNTTMGACHLATDSNQMIESVPSSIQTVAGLALSELPSELFGKLAINATQPSWNGVVAANSGGSNITALCRVDRGLIYTSRNDPNTVEVGAGSTTACVQQCLSFASCVGVQYINSDLLSVSARLYGLQTLPCLLLLGSEKYPSKVTPSDPSIMAGVIDCTHADSSLKYEVNNLVLTENDKSLLDGAVFYRSQFGTGTNDVVGDQACKYQGNAFLGNLVDAPINSIDNSTLVDCTSKCLESEPPCAGVSLGSWGTCYLYRDITGIVADPAMVSASQNVTVCNLDRPEQVSTRELIDCTNIGRQVVFTSGIVVGNITSESADELTADKCFKACREETGCNYMSYVENRDADSTSPIKAGCVLLSRASDPSILSGAISTASNCDVRYDSLNFGDEPSMLAKYAKLEWRLFGIISGATVGAIAIIGSAIILLQHRRTQRMPGGDSTNRHNDSQSDSTEVEIEYGEDSLSLMDPMTAKSRNAFGMNLLENEDTPVLSDNASDQGLRADDFQLMEAKSTVHRLRLKRVL